MHLPLKILEFNWKMHIEKSRDFRRSNASVAVIFQKYDAQWKDKTSLNINKNYH